MGPRVARCSFERWAMIDLVGELVGSLAEHLRRHSTYEGEGGDVLDDHRTRRDHGTLADFNSSQDHGARGHPGPRADTNRAASGSNEDDWMS